MKIIDARSGDELQVGTVVRYPQGEWTRLDRVMPGILGGMFSAKAQITHVHVDYRSGALVERTDIVPLAVRWMHPSFPGQHVAFIPS